MLLLCFYFNMSWLCSYLVPTNALTGHWFLTVGDFVNASAVFNGENIGLFRFKNKAASGLKLIWFFKVSCRVSLYFCNFYYFSEIALAAVLHELEDILVLYPEMQTFLMKFGILISRLIFCIKLEHSIIINV